MAATGPAEAAVEEVVRARAPEAGPVTVQLASRRSRSDVRVEAADPAGLAVQLTGAPEVERATPFATCVEVRSSLPFLYEAVVPAVEAAGPAYGRRPEHAGAPVLVTFSDPNTNKPLHVGHLRNLFLGAALAGVHEALGHPVRREGTMGDWGVHMCQALLAYLDSGEGGTPEEAGVKGDHFVGGFYTRYHAGAAAEGDDEDDRLAHALLLRLEADPELSAVHDRLATWAKEGITETYRRVGAEFDAVFHETDHLGDARRVIAEGLASGRLRFREDGCVVFDVLADDSQIPLVRSDGTLLVYAQILGIDVARFAARPDHILSIFGHQWERAALSYRAMAEGLGLPWGARYEPLFYAMVQLPSGSMRSRAGRTVTADDAVDDVAAALRPWADDLAEGVGLDELAVAVVKYHLLRQPRTKTLVFDVDQVVGRSAADFARLASWAGWLNPSAGGPSPHGQDDHEAVLRQVLLTLSRFPTDLQRAADVRDPAVLVRYLDDLVVLADRLAGSPFAGGRLHDAVASVIRHGLAILAITPRGAFEHRRQRCQPQT